MTKFGIQLALSRPVPASKRSPDAAVRSTFAPRLPQRGTPRSDTLTDILPPFGTNPPSGPVSSTEADLSQRLIQNDPRESWYLTLPSKLAPKQVLQILRSALGGDLWQQHMLGQLMLDSWPRFRKCAYELRMAVAQTKFTVKPFALPGKEPSDKAKAKADLVARAMAGFNPDPFTDERGFHDMVYHLTEPALTGIALEELVWKDAEEYEPGKWQRTPRAAVFIHPRHFTFTNQGRVVIFSDGYGRKDLFNSGPVGYHPDPDKFICGQFVNSGSSLAAGFMRPLAWYWAAKMFNEEWMLQFAQRYGNPFLELEYEKGLQPEEMTALENFAKDAGAQNYLLHPTGSNAKIHPAQSLGTDNPQVHIDRVADEACAELLLGQAATTSPTPGKLGNDETHGRVKREYVEMLAGWTAANPLKQFARALVRVNYGDELEVPEVLADFTESPDPTKVAQTWSSRLMSGLPFVAEEYYKENNCRQPQAGDLVVCGGVMGRMSDPVEVVEVGPQPELEEDFNGAVRAASPVELRELRTLVLAAKAAPHPNGELTVLRAKVRELNARRRR